MALNDQKTCIRPTFNRSFFISEKTIENTTVVAVGRQFQGANQGGLVVGYFNKAERDFVFTNPTLLNGDANQVQQFTLTTGSSVPFLVGEDLSANGTPAQIVGVDNRFGQEPIINLLNGTVNFKSSSKNLETNWIPTTVAKIESNPNQPTDSTR